MSTITVYTAKELLEAAKADKTALMVVAKKEAKTYKGNASFMNNYIKNVKRAGKNTDKAKPWVTVTEEVPLMEVMDPAKKREGTEDMKPKLRFKMSKGGDFAELLNTLQPQWDARINEHIKAGTIKKNDQRKIHDLLKYRISENAPENAGELMEDPTVEIKIDFAKFPDTYFISWLAGKSKTTILDYNKQTVKDGKVVYGPATVKNDAGVEEPVSFENLHKFITKGSVMKRGRFEFTSTSVSQYWISMQINAQELVIATGGPGGFDEEEPEDPEPINLDAADEAPADEAAAEEVEAVEEASAADVSAAIDDI